MSRPIHFSMPQRISVRRSRKCASSNRRSCRRSNAMANNERPAPAVEPPSTDLAALYQSWRIIDLLGETIEQLPPAWLKILNIARTLLDGDPIPGMSVPDGLTALVTRDPEFTYERRRV